MPNPYIRQTLSKRFPNRGDDAAIYEMMAREVHPVLTQTRDTLHSVIEKEAINAKLFGAKGDGEADDTPYLLDAISSGERYIKFPPGEYRLTHQGLSFLKASSVDNLTLWGYGATLKIGDGESTGDDQDIESVGLYLDLWTNSSIFGLTVDANRATRTTSLNNTVSHCMRIRGGSNLLLCDVSLLNAPFDGLYVRGSSAAVASTYPTNLVFRNLYVNNSYRNGISLIGARKVWIWGGSFNGSSGVAPMAGIDVEPNTSDIHGVTDLYINGVRCDDNGGIGMMLTGGNASSLTQRVKVRDYASSGNVGGALAVSYAKSVDIDGLTVHGQSTVLLDTDGVTPARALVDIKSTAEDVSFRNASFRDITGMTSAQPLLYIDNGSNEGFEVDGFVARNVTGYAMHILNKCVVRNVSIDDVAGNPYCILLSGDGGFLDGLYAANCPSQVLRTVGLGVVHKNLTFIDCGALSGSGTSVGNGAIFRMLGSGTSSYSNVVSNMHVFLSYAYQGYNALYMDDAPAVLENFLAKATGTDWSNSNVIRIPASIASSRWRNVKPSPLTVTKSITPGDIDTLKHYSTTATPTYAAVGSASVRLKHSVSLGGLTSHASVSAANTYTITYFNPTTALIPDIGAHDVEFEGEQ